MVILIEEAWWLIVFGMIRVMARYPTLWSLPVPACHMCLEAFHKIDLRSDLFGFDTNY